MSSKAVIVKSGNQVEISRAKPILDMNGNLQIHTVTISHLVVTADIIPEYMNIETSKAFRDGSGATSQVYRVEFGEFRLDFKDKKVSELYINAILKIKYDEVEDISSKFPEADI